MAKQVLALEQGGPKRLEISWEGTFKNFTIKLDGSEVGKLADQNALKLGQSFGLPDGSTLSVKLKSATLASELEVLRNGKPVPGSATDPVTRLSSAWGVLYFIGGFNVLLGIAAVVFQWDFLLNLGIGVFSAGFGAVYLLLGYLTSRRILIALIAAIVLFAIDGVLGVVSAIGNTSGSPVAGIVVRLLFLWVLVQGIGAIAAIKQDEKAAATSMG
jgi:hypothetical protein